MRIEVSVAGIRKERGKLPAPTTLAAPRLGLPLAAGPPICAELANPALSEPVTGAEVGVSVATEHPVNTEMIKRMEYDHQPPPVSRQQQPAACSGVRSPRVAPFPSTAWHRASHRALRRGRPACAGQSRRRHGSGEPLCTWRQFPAASCRLPGQGPDRSGSMSRACRRPVLRL